MRKPGDLIVKDSSSDEPQGFDWTAWLAELGVGVVINASTWTISGTDALLTSHNPAIVTGLKTLVYLAAGTTGARYTVVNRITTNSSPPVTDERSFDVFVTDR